VAARWAQPAVAVMCAQAVAATTMLNTEGVAVSLSMHQLMHFFSAMRATGAATISTILDDGQQEFPIAQLEDELFFQRGKRCHGPRLGNKGE
jgi:flagellar motor protein MotB